MRRSMTLGASILAAMTLAQCARGGIVDNGVPAFTAVYAGYGSGSAGEVAAEDWLRAERLTGFHLLGSAGPATQQTEVRVCYDRKHLYVRFECHEASMDRLVAKYTEDQSPVWQDDSVEVFVVPYGVASEPRCHQFVVNAAGAKAHLPPDGVARGTWRATVARMSDRWVAEIAIPFDTLRPMGRNEDCWRVNFGRNEHPHGETSSWSAVPRWFRTYSRFGRMLAPASAFRFNTYRGPLTCLEARPDGPEGLDSVSGPVREVGRQDTVVIPEPREFHRRPSKEPFRIRADTRIVIADDADAADVRTVEEINAAIVGLGGRPLDSVRAGVVSKDPAAAENFIVIGESARNSLARAITAAREVRLPRSPFGTGAHLVDVLPSRIVVLGQTPVDTYYGVQTLKQLLRAGADGEVFVNSCCIRDYPRFAFRGVHLLASRDALTFLGKLITNLLAPLKVNHIVLQTDKIEWNSHPEVTDPHNSMPQEDVRQLLEIARRHHITVTPLVQSPGHLEWAFRGGANLEFAEDPNEPYCYCMSNPKSYEFIFGIMDEAIELFGSPEYFHAGRDEFDMRGNLPVDEVCRAIGKERLYIQDTLKVYEHLRSRGCRMMMWGDILTKPGFREFVDELPRDILINDWRYAPSETYPTIDFYQEHGFPVLGCTWYNPHNIYSFSRYAARRDILGMLHTTWTGFESEEAVLGKYPEQVYAYVLGAAWAWNPDRPDVDDLPYRPRGVFERAWRDATARADSRFAVVRLDRHFNISRVDSGRSIGWIGVGRGDDLRGLPEGLVSIEGVPYRIGPANLASPGAVMLGAPGVADALPRAVEGVLVDGRARALRFLHGCAYGADHGAKVGSYVVRYADGSVEQIPLTFGMNIHAWDDRSLGMSYGFAWRGRGRDGAAVGVGDLVWVNPRPDAKIKAIDFVGAGTQASPFLLAVTAEL